MPQDAEPADKSDMPSATSSPEQSDPNLGEKALEELRQLVLDGAVKLGPNSPFVFHPLPPRDNKPGS